MRTRASAPKEPLRETELGARTIEDFGDQWLRYRDNEGYYGEIGMLADILGKLLPVSALKGARFAEIGSGTGRIVRMLLQAGVAHVTAVEPSAAFEVLRDNLRGKSSRVTLVSGTGADLHATQSRFRSGNRRHPPHSRAGSGSGRGLWSVAPGRRNDRLGLRLRRRRTDLWFIKALRRVTTRLPHWLLAPLCHVLAPFSTSTR